ncbi:MAG: PAS domain S-box protein, partial [Thermoplasmata archaeon]
KGNFDIVTTEYHLRWGNGIEVLRGVKKKNPFTPVIMFTGAGTEEVAVEAMKYGLDDYIIKKEEYFMRLPAAVHVVMEKIQERIKRKRAEEALKESEEKYRTLVEQSPDGIFIVDLQGNFLSVNKAMCNVLRYSEKELLSMNIWDVVPKRYQKLYKKRIAKILKGEHLTEPAEYEVKARDGKVYTIEVRSVPYIKAGKIVGFQGIARDVTERKKMEKELKKNLEYLQRFHDATVDRELKMRELKEKIKEYEKLIEELKRNK